MRKYESCAALIGHDADLETNGCTLSSRCRTACSDGSTVVMRPMKDGVLANSLMETESMAPICAPTLLEYVRCRDGNTTVGKLSSAVKEASPNLMILTMDMACVRAT